MAEYWRKEHLRIDPYHRLDLSATYRVLEKVKWACQYSTYITKPILGIMSLMVVDNQVTETNVNYIGFTLAYFLTYHFKTYNDENS